MYTMTGNEWEQVLESRGKEFLQLAEKIQEAYKKWYAAGYGLDDNALATALVKTVAWVADARIAFDDLKAIADTLDSIAATARDRKTTILKFTDVR
jgi:hypothetical protein